MSNSADQVSEDIKTAMRAKDSVALNSLRALKRAQELCEGRADGKTLSAAVMSRLS